MTRIKLLLAVALFAAAAAVVWWRFKAPAAPMSWQGYVDADYVKVAPTQQGLLVSLAVQRGDSVKAGAPLFAQDDKFDRAARDEAAAKLAQAEAQLSNLQSASRETEIAQAAADLADLRATQERTQLDLQRAEALERTAAGTRQQLDQARANALSAVAKVQAAEAKLAQMQSPTGRTQEIAAQQALVGEMRAQLAEAEWRLAQRHVAAPASALVADIYAWPGETMAAGSPVVSLLPAGNILVRFFVSEPELPHIHPGERVAVACDTCPRGMSAIVSFVAPQPEYTPPVIFSEQTRDKLTYQIEARPSEDEDRALKPGQPVSVRLLSEGAKPS
ncbi:MAG TPA: HlyD family efflux transporter periplasmic adaptor subunit [Acetobacteraceae bacterium]